MTRRLALVLLALLLGACAAPSERPETLRQALVGLGREAAERLAQAPPLPRTPADQVVLLANPEVDPALGIDSSRLHEALSRGLLGLGNGPQVVDWQDNISGDGIGNLWRLDCRLMTDGPRLTLSDRNLLPYRLTLQLRPAGSDEVVWQETLHGAFDATAL